MNFGDGPQRQEAGGAIVGVIQRHHCDLEILNCKFAIGAQLRHLAVVVGSLRGRGALGDRSPGVGYFASMVCETIEAK